LADAHASTSASSSSSSAPVGKASSSGGGETGAESWAAWAGKTKKLIADKAREVAYDKVPQAEGGGGSTGGGGGSSGSPKGEDVERGEGSGPKQLAQLGSWAKKAAKNVKHQVSHSELGEQAKGLRSEVSKGLKNVSENAQSASAALADKGKAAQDMAKDLQGKGKAKLKDAKAVGAVKAKEAKDKAAAAAQVAAQGAKGAVSQAGQSFSGLAALTLSPAKLAQFGGVFLVGIFLISASVSFLPVMVIAPQKFALLFAFGSMTLLSSFAILKGPQAFASSLIEAKKLPFTVAYAVGLLGTLVATIGMKSFLLTAIFGVLQVFALLYFLASYVPGGQMILSMCGRCCKRSARAVGGRLMT